MRVMVLVLLIGCGVEPSTGEPVYSDCSPGNCGGRPDPDGPARTVHIVWTIEQQPASPSLCANSPDYAARLQTDPTRPQASDLVIYPVPCDEGELTIADVPARYWVGGMQTSLSGNYSGAAGPFDEDTQTATIDMRQW